MEWIVPWFSQGVLGTKIQWEKLECNQWHVLCPCCLFSFFFPLSGVNVILEYNNWFLDKSKMLSNLIDERYFSNHLVDVQYLTCCKVIICGTRKRLSAEIPTTVQFGLIESPICSPPQHCWSKPGSSLISWQEKARAGNEIPFLWLFNYLLYLSTQNVPRILG